MSVTKASLPLGLGNLYLKKNGAADSAYALIGTLSGDVEFTYSPETVERKAGDVLGPVRRDVVDEHAMLKASVCDLKIAQLIAALGTSQSITGLTATRSQRIEQELNIGYVSDTQTLSHTAVSITSVRVFKMDRSTEGAYGTDFTMATAYGITAKGATFLNIPVRVYYTWLNTSARRVRMGNQSVFQEVSLLFVHKKSDGKHIQIEIPKATIQGDLVIPWHEKDYTGYDITFGALVDTSKASGTGLFTITEEV